MNEYEEIMCFFINGYIETTTFEEWIYTDENMSEYADKLYNELISFNYRDKNAIVSLKNSLRRYLMDKCNINCDSISEAYVEKRAIDEYRRNTTKNVYIKLFEYFNKPREKEIVLAVSTINSSNELQVLLKEKLGFPEFYGMNWDAFWDAITGLVEMPERLTIIGWNELQKKLPRDAELMKKLLSDLNSKHSKLGL